MAAHELEYYEKVYYGKQVEGRGLETPEALKRSFSRLIRHYDEVVGPHLPASKEAFCLDLACGYGNWLYYLQQRGFKNAHGVDLDPRQVELAKSLGLDARVADVREALNAEGQFDLISGFDLIEHLDKNSAVMLLQQIHRALKDEGKVVLQCPCADGFTGCHDMCNDLTHKWSPSSTMLKQLLRTVGFKRVEIVDLSLPPFPTRASRKMLFAVRKLARKVVCFQLRILGVLPPQVWSNSMIAVVYK